MCRLLEGRENDSFLFYLFPLFYPKENSVVHGLWRMVSGWSGVEFGSGGALRCTAKGPGLGVKSRPLAFLPVVNRKIQSGLQHISYILSNYDYPSQLLTAAAYYFQSWQFSLVLLQFLFLGKSKCNCEIFSFGIIPITRLGNFLKLLKF